MLGVVCEKGSMTNQQTEQVEIDDPMVLDAINDPLRFRVWRQLARPRSAKELSPLLGTPAGRLYYHLNLLERHGWIKVAEERKAGTRIERYWVASFASYRLSERLAASGEARDSGALIGALEDMVGEFQSTVAQMEDRRTPDHGAQMILNRFRRLSADRAYELADKVSELIDDYLGPATADVVDSGPDEVPIHGALFMLFPFDELPASQGG